MQISSSTTLPATYYTTGIVFPDGAVPAATTPLQYQVGTAGVLRAVQMDAKTSWPDGDVRTAIVSFQAPPYKAGTHTAGYMVKRGGAAGGASVSLSGFAPGVATVDVVTSSKSNHLDVAQMLASQTPSYWLQGPLVTEARVDSGALEGSLHVAIDARAYADGTSRIDVTFANDLAHNVGVQETYTATIKLGTQTVTQSIASPGQSPLTNWHQVLYSAGLSPPGILAHDTVVMQAAGIVPAYDLSNGVQASEITDELPSYPGNQGVGGNYYGPCDPLGTCGYRRYMGTTGGRQDIGVIPRWDQIVLDTYDPSAWGFMLQQADAAGGIPWHVAETDEHPIDVRTYPNWWDDNRCGNPVPQCSPIDYQAAQNNADHGLLIVPAQNGQPPIYGVQLDFAHTPETGLVAYLMTGSRHYLDEMIADAGKANTATWPYGVRLWYDAATNPYQDLIIGRNWQLRAGAWSSRSLLAGELVVPDGWPQKSYFSTVLQHNLSFIAANAAANPYGSKGPLAGWIDSYGESGNVVAPWQNDYLALTLEWGTAAGVPGMAGALSAMTPFLVGRFNQPANVFSPYDGGAYFLGVFASDNQTPLTTWAAVEQNTIAMGLSNAPNPPGVWACADYDTAAQSVLDGLPVTPAQQQAKGWVDSHISTCRNPTWLLNGNH